MSSFLGFCEWNTRNRWRDGQVCPDVDKELWRLGPDGSGVFWRVMRQMNGVHLALRHEGQKVNRIVMTSERNGELSSREGVVQKFRFRFLQLSSGGFLNLQRGVR
ncbi:hypothetical protein TNCV_501811 [Trichonephila clavipes]|nr:hypothetical protein TNCV_501811 [Trichonephila clavipes]